MYKDTLGLIGGFGGYATLDFYRRFLETFRGENERCFPHIIIDNDFTMPSRTRSLLTGEGHDEIVAAILRSMKTLSNGGADHIILVCGTAHYFLEDVYAKMPEAREKVVDIINTLGDELQATGIDKVLILAAEGTLLQRLYPVRFEKYGINCIQPGEADYPEIRYFLESVKQNTLDRETDERFLSFLGKFATKNVVLGCTELPVVLGHCLRDPGFRDRLRDYAFYDPLESVLTRLKTIIH